MNKEILDELNKTEIALQESNDNPYTFEWMIRNNMMDCGSFLSPYDQKWSVLSLEFSAVCFQFSDVLPFLLLHAGATEQILSRGPE